MPTHSCALWQNGVPLETALSLQEALSHTASNRGLQVFFRADDIGVPSRAFRELTTLFGRYRAPLALAVVPAWLTRPRWLALTTLAAGDNTLWCWHQHGWRHVNHERQGKKQEFGPARPKAPLAVDLTRGRRCLQAVMDRAFSPIFTPPWNRCSLDTLKLLKTQGYWAVSRRAGSRPHPPADLPDIAVNVDLHTRKEQDPQSAWQNLLQELAAAATEGRCGVMIYHRCMNPAAFEFLDMLLEILSTDPRVQLVAMPELAPDI